MKRKYQLARPYIDDSDIKRVVDVLKSGSLSLGPEHKKFEELFSQRLKTKYAVSVANGTCGLHLAVKALNIGDGDEVITTPFSFVSSANCILYERAKPVFVDIEEESFNIDPEKIEKAITKKTKAILVVHIFGQSAQMDRIMQIAKKHKLAVIEDACESLGAGFKGKLTGTFGDIGVFAFYPNKQMTTAEGGMIITNNRKHYEYCKSMRNQGRLDSDQWLRHENLGYNYRLSELHAALGLSQLKKLNWMTQEKRKIVDLYNHYLKDKQGITLPKVADNRTHTWFVYVVRIISKNRDAIMKRLDKIGIQTKPYLPSIHLQPYIRKMYNYKKGDFPVSEKISSQTLALPLYIGMLESDVKYIADKLQTLINPPARNF